MNEVRKKNQRKSWARAIRSFMSFAVECHTVSESEQTKRILGGDLNDVKAVAERLKLLGEFLEETRKEKSGNNSRMEDMVEMLVACSGTEQQMLFELLIVNRTQMLFMQGMQRLVLMVAKAFLIEDEVIEILQENGDLDEEDIEEWMDSLNKED